jgi:hypothetical protein
VNSRRFHADDSQRRHRVPFEANERRPPEQESSTFLGCQKVNFSCPAFGRQDLCRPSLIETVRVAGHRLPLATKLRTRGRGALSGYTLGERGPVWEEA